jgi:hypothetical protein
MPLLPSPNAKEQKMTYSDESVLPRPVEALPDYASARARQTLTERLKAAFRLSDEAATTIANAVVDPAEVRKTIGEPTDPGVEEIPVPGGTLLGIRTSIWARRAIPDPRNPRILPARRHPFAVEPGTGSEESKFRPIPEPKPRDTDHPEEPELCVEIESQHQLVWASQQASKHILADNNWCTSIASQGVMEAVWLVATTYDHQDGSGPVTTLTTVEGSSRLTAVHNLLKIRSADVPYEEQEIKLRSLYRKLNERLDAGNATGEDQIALRCERIPALILVGFRRHGAGTTGFATAVKSMVALRHVDPPKPWGEGPENESLAEEVLDELYRQGLISATKRDYFAGSCTKAEAKAAHLSDDPAIRAAQITELFLTRDSQTVQAIRVAVTSQSTRKRITPKLMNELATALILRAVADDQANTDQIRRYLKHAYGKAAHREKWAGTDRTTEQLADEAMKEVHQAYAGSGSAEPGPASLELGVRAAYPLIVSGRLNADRGTNNNQQPDRRTPGEVLDVMRQTPQGILQLAQALKDFAAGRPIRAVDEDGQVKQLADKSGEQTVNDILLREEYPPAGKARAARTGETNADRFHNRVNDFARTMEQLTVAFEAVAAVVGDDGRPLVETSGVDKKQCSAWRDQLSRVDEELVIWGRRFQSLYAASTRPDQGQFHDDHDQPEPDADVYADAEDWDTEVAAMGSSN